MNVSRFKVNGMQTTEAVALRCFMKKLFKKEILAQVFRCEFCEIFKYTFFHGTPAVAASKTIFTSSLSSVAKLPHSTKMKISVNPGSPSYANQLTGFYMMGNIGR